MNRQPHITILGAGIAGLAAGYFAKKKDIPFTIYEAGDRIGGNCVTFRHGDFFFDSGAHRFHDRDREITEEVKGLLGNDLMKVSAPSRIYHNGSFLEFPFSKLDLLKNLGMTVIIKAISGAIYANLRSCEPAKDFESYAFRKYGRAIARNFLLNYSEKLWGMTCSKLSADIAGERLKGLDLSSFISGNVFGRKSHMEGPFYYPKNGIGAIADKLGQSCGEQNIITNSRTTKILHDSKRIQSLEVNGSTGVDVDELIVTFPVNIFLNIMEPSPPTNILEIANSLRYRNVILVALFIDKESVTNCATLYFPDADLPFTRIYEPKNRSLLMSPAGKTSLVAEIPCGQDDETWGKDDESLIRTVRSRIVKLGLVGEKNTMDAFVVRLGHAYPVLDLGYKEKVGKIDDYLKGFSNLKVSGRSGKFAYAWIHDLMRAGKEIIGEYR